MVIFICSLIVLQQRDTVALGQMREGFDGANRSKPSSRYRNGLQSYPTEIYFPEGKADQRLLINVDHRTKNGVRYDLYSLAYQIKEGGKVVDKWTVPLEQNTAPPVLIPDHLRAPMGSFTSMLLRRGLLLDADAPFAVKQRLDQQEGYAGYWLGSRLSDEFWYWHVDSDGTTAAPHALDLSSYKRDYVLPHLPVPYPISGEELAALKGGKVARGK